MGLKSPFLVPLLFLAAAAFFFIKDANWPSISEPSESPVTDIFTSAAPKGSTLQCLAESDECIRRSEKIYRVEIAEFKALERKLGYFRFRDDRYGKGFNTIMKEQLARKSDC